jgi:hypothetical protein
MQTTTINKQIIYRLGDKDFRYPLSQIYSSATETKASATIKNTQSASATIKNTQSASATIKKIQSSSATNKNTQSASATIKKIQSASATNKKIQSASATIKKIQSSSATNKNTPSSKLFITNNNDQLYLNNSLGSRSDPFLWLFPDPDLLLDGYVPYLLQLYSQQSKSYNI